MDETVTPRPTIGILGGMGPEATILLMQRIMAATPAPEGRARDDADHIPLLVDNNTAVPSRIRHLIEGTGEDPGPVLAAMARRLETAGAHALAMPCNTAHSYAAAVRGAAKIPFLDMVALTAAATAPSVTAPSASMPPVSVPPVSISSVATPSADMTSATVPDGMPAGPAGILASPATRRTGIFAEAFAATGRGVLYPADEAAMLAAIRAVKAGDTEAARPVLTAAAAELGAAGAGVLVVGCSEFSLLSRALMEDRTGKGGPLVVDTLDVLAAACVRFALSPASLSGASGSPASLSPAPASPVMQPAS